VAMAGEVDASMKFPFLSVALLFVVAGSACASLPRIQTAQNCDAVSPSSMVVRSVDRSGRDIPFAPISITSDNRAIRIATSTSSAGIASFPVHPGSYAVVVGDNGGDWQSARRSVEVRPGCVVTVRAELLEHEFAPEDTHLRTRVRR